MESGNGKAVSMTCFRTNRSNGLQLVPEAPSENNSEEKTKTQPILTRGFDPNAFHTYKQTRISAGLYRFLYGGFILSLLYAVWRVAG